MSYQETEFDRRLANIVRLGVVNAIDLVGQLVQVDIGTTQEPQLTAWLPWMTRRAGQTRHWSPPDVNEQVVILSPGGELAQGVVLPGALYQDLFTANGSAQLLDRTTYPDGSVVEYDAAAHKLTVTVGTGSVVINCATATVNASTSVKLDTPATTMTGTLAVTGKITGSGGLAISGGSGATVAGSMTISGGDVKADGIGLKSHIHSDPQGGSVGTGQG